MIIADFRAEFPEFASTVTYPDPQITFWATIAEKMVVECIWTDMYTFGVKLYVAHELTLYAQNQKAAAAGGVPGTFGGPAQSKTVGAVSVSYDSANTSEKDAGWWNLSNYGKQFYRLMMIFGAGCIQL